MTEHLTDVKDLAELRPCYSIEGLTEFIAKHFPTMELRPISDCPVIFDRAGRCGPCTACGANFTCGAALEYRLSNGTGQ